MLKAGLYDDLIKQTLRDEISFLTKRSKCKIKAPQFFRFIQT